MAGRILVDTAPLRESRDFRLLFSSQLVSTLGNQLVVVAIPFQVYAMTRSSVQVGAVSLVQLVPLVLASLVGGSVGDAVDRRTLLLASVAASVATSAALAVNATLAHPSLPAIYLVSALAAGLTGFSNPARNAAVPTLVARRHLVAAFASVQIVYQVGTVVGPALSGVLITHAGLGWVYGIDAGTFVGALVALQRMAPIPPVAGARRPGLGSILEGLRYVRGRQPLEGAYAIDVNAMVFGMPRALFPALAETVFHGGASTLGYLYAAPGVGALVGAVTTGWVTRLRRRGLAVVVAVVVWGVAITALGFSRTLWLSLVLLAVAGWADVISAVLRNTIVQTSGPEELRSRLSSIQMAVVQGGPRLGDMESGVVAGLVSTEFSIVSGGVACVVGALALAALLPGFRRHRADDAAPGDGGSPGGGGGSPGDGGAAP